MLNKLLKRCLPWMDKGRWVQIRVVGTDPSSLSIIYNDNKIVRAEVTPKTDGDPSMTVVFKDVPRIIDFKYCPEEGFEYQIIPGLSITHATLHTIDVLLNGPGTYWFFMR